MRKQRDRTNTSDVQFSDTQTPTQTSLMDIDDEETTTLIESEDDLNL